MNENEHIPEKEIAEIIGLIKKITKDIGLLDNPYLKKIFVNNRLKIPYGLNNMHLSSILLISIDPIKYDCIFQEKLNNPNLKFFGNLEQLIKNVIQKNDASAKLLISKFLEIKIIKNFRKSDTRNLTSSMMMDEEIQNMAEKLKKNGLDFYSKSDILKASIVNVHRKTKKLLNIERRKKTEAENLINHIKNHYETMRYIFGLILGLFDILQGCFNPDLSYYYNLRNSPAQLYYPPKNRYKKRLWLKAYFKFPEYGKKFSSIQFLLEEWILKEFRELRIFKAHREIDITQDKLSEGLYKIETETFSKELTLKELDEIERDAFTFILWTKHLVAKLFFANNDNLISYLFEAYK